MIFALLLVLTNIIIINHLLVLLFVLHYWYFFNYTFKFQPNVCNGYHNLLMMSISLSNIAILNIKCSDCSCITAYKWYIMIELTFVKEFMSIKQVHQKSMIFVTIGIS